MAVYFIGNGQGQVKIGVSQSPMARLRDLQTANHCDLKLLVCIPGAERTETEMHTRFSSGHIRGEWFDITSELEVAITVYKEYHDSYIESLKSDDRRIYEDAWAEYHAAKRALDMEYDSKIEKLEKAIEQLERIRDKKEDDLDEEFDRITEGIHPWWLLGDGSAIGHAAGLIHRNGNGVEVL